MTSKEFNQLVLTIKVGYPSSNIFPDAYAVKVWFQMLGDLDYHQAANAVAEHMTNSSFPPSIADIRKRCTACKIDIPDWAEAWEKVQQAIRHYGAYRDDEALESLDEITRTAVRRMGYKSLCYSELKNAETDRAQFREIYNLVARPRIENAQLPPAVLEEKEKIRRKYIGDNQPERPKQISTADIIEEELSRKAKPDYVAGLVDAAKRLLGSK